MTFFQSQSKVKLLGILSVFDFKLSIWLSIRFKLLIIEHNGLQAWNVGLFGVIFFPPERKVAARSELRITTEPPYILCLLLAAVLFFLSFLWLIVVWKWWFWFLNFFHFSSWIFHLKPKKLPSCKTCFSAFLQSKTACLKALIFAFPTSSNHQFSSFQSNKF